MGKDTTAQTATHWGLESWLPGVKAQHNAAAVAAAPCNTGALFSVHDTHTPKLGLGRWPEAIFLSFTDRTDRTCSHSTHVSRSRQRQQHTTKPHAALPSTTESYAFALVSADNAKSSLTHSTTRCHCQPACAVLGFPVPDPRENGDMATLCGCS